MTVSRAVRKFEGNQDGLKTSLSRIAMRLFVSLFLCMITTFVAPVPSAQALLFNVTYDASISSAPPQLIPAFKEATSFFERTFIDPITINLNVGWGVAGGFTISPGSAAVAADPMLYQFGMFNSLQHYNFLRDTLIADSSSFADTVAISLTSLPILDPTGGLGMTMSPSESKALGLRPAHDPGKDADIIFNPNITWTFDPNNRAIAGAYDFIGAAEHEISHAMGRISIQQTIGVGWGGVLVLLVTPLDLYRYSSPGTRALTGGKGQYFSINSGKNKINTFADQGDTADWAGFYADSYNLYIAPGTMQGISVGDITEMDVIGYDLRPPVGGCGPLVSIAAALPPPPSPCSAPDIGALVDPDVPPDIPPGVEAGSLPFGEPLTSIPEPGSLALLATGLVCLGMARRKEQALPSHPSPNHACGSPAYGFPMFFIPRHAPISSRL